MGDAGIRVALLAKAGESRNQLRTALQDLGAELVCEGDPSELSPSAVSELNPKVMVVSLEPSIEAALDKFDDLLSSSNMEVVYDDAEVSGKLDGWDLNRWARHLAAKIIGTDLMPPVPAGSAMEPHDEWHLQPGAPETPAQAMADAKLEDYLHGTSSLATDVPVNESYSDALQRDVPLSHAHPEHEASLDVNLDDLEQAMRLNLADEHQESMSETKIELENRAPAVDEHALAEFDGFMSAEAAAVIVSDNFIAPATTADSIADDFPTLPVSTDDGATEAFAAPEAFSEFANQDFAMQATESDETPVVDFDLPEMRHSDSNGTPDEPDFISFDNVQAQFKDEISLGDDADFNIDLSAFEIDQSVVAEHASLDFEDNANTLTEFEVSEQPVLFTKYQADDAPEMSASMDDDVAALAAQLDEFEKNDSRAVAQNMDFSDLQNDSSSRSSTAQDKARDTKPIKEPEAVQQTPKFDLSSLSLLDMDAEIPMQTAVQVAATSNLLKRNKFALESIEGDAPTEKPLSDIGAVLILAGMGGPDAVRQLLKVLPDSLNVPVLLYQHLEVGKHDRLVTQLEKVSNLPVYLAVQGRTAEPGQVAVIPAGVGLELVGNELFFGGAESQQALVESLPAQHSVVIILSGAAIETVAAAVNLQNQGGMALAQDPSNCFEPAAAEALLQQGGLSAEISVLATMVLEYFKQ